MTKKHNLFKVFLRVAYVLIAISVVFTGIFAFYVNDYYHASDSAQTALNSTAQVSVTKVEGNYIFSPENSDTGLIFYPGGKVEVTAYAPLMQAFAREGVTCVLASMPFNLAVFNIGAADGVSEKFPAIEHWYLAGHSLGGAMAASYLSSHLNDYDGLILMGAYSTSPLKREGLKAVAFVGSQDNVMNRSLYDSSRDNLPNDKLEFTIEGGCHSYFGDYGMQNGDGVPTITREQQTQLIVSTCKEYFQW